GSRLYLTTSPCYIEIRRHIFRFVAPESLLYQTHNDLSLMWNLGVFMWQICTDCRHVPFFQHRNRQSFLEAIFSYDLVLMDSDKNSSSDELELLNSEMKVPQCIRNSSSDELEQLNSEMKVPQCIRSEPSDDDQSQRQKATSGRRGRHWIQEIIRYTIYKRDCAIYSMIMNAT
ncbi:hypothetical protein OSTOST_12767, partial [Ostertagia ostertagi]